MGLPAIVGHQVLTTLRADHRTFSQPVVTAAQAACRTRIALEYERAWSLEPSAPCHPELRTPAAS